ncbi:hypothetical protein [Streptomonospora arabica]|uniref:Uncharacterized protein n=1 Tax=Streptomonospora arabica TaxID=412417 RepID=A0ABV9SIP8_9ACTN
MDKADDGNSPRRRWRGWAVKIGVSVVLTLLAFIRFLLSLFEQQ